MEDSVSLTLSINDEPNSDESQMRHSQSISLRSYNKWSPNDHGATLAWRDVSIYVVKNKRKIKRIINNSTGAITSGTMVALMGSSGSGKTSLMSALAYRNSPDTVVNGDILVNGCKIGPFMHRLSGFVHQEDLFYGTLTVLEHLTCMAHMKLDRKISSHEISYIIKDVLDRTGLSHCLHTRIGYEGDGKVMSGGEKKRLAFATELLTQPAILFCDEPTTGLDSFNAQKLVLTLQELAQTKNTAILCTIHQPSSELFAMFDQVLLLAEGRIAFFGHPDDAIEFFAEQGYKCPVNYNPAEYLINALSITNNTSECSNHKAAARICDWFAVSEASQHRDLLVNLEMHMYETGTYSIKDGMKGFSPPLYFTTFYWLTWRAFLTVLRDPTVQFMRILQKIGIAITAGLCFAGSIDRTQMGVQAITGILFIFVAENTFTPMYSVLSVFPQTFPLFMREIKSGVYSPDQFYLANIVAMIPGLIFEPLIFVIIAYWIAELRPTLTAFITTALASTLIMNVSTACGCFFSATFSSVPLAMAYLVPFDYILMTTSGVFMALNTLPQYLSWIPFFNWLMYGNEIMNIAQWEGVTNITCRAEENTQFPCYQTGDEVLQHYNFSENHFYINFVAMILLYFLFHLLGYIFLCRRTRSM